MNIAVFTEVSANIKTAKRSCRKAILVSYCYIRYKWSVMLKVRKNGPLECEHVTESYAVGAYVSSLENGLRT